MNESVRAELAAIMALVQAGQKDEAGGRFFSLYCIICAQCRVNRLELLSLLLMAVLFTQSSARMPATNSGNRRGIAYAAHMAVAVPGRYPAYIAHPPGDCCQKPHGNTT